MQVAEQLDSVTIERLRRQGELLLKMYEAEFSIDPTSGGTESSRRNLIDLQHTVKQVYGEAVMRVLIGQITVSPDLAVESTLIGD
jgi:hypothetical protein